MLLTPCSKKENCCVLRLNIWIIKSELKSGITWHWSPGSGFCNVCHTLGHALFLLLCICFLISFCSCSVSSHPPTNPWYKHLWKGVKLQMKGKQILLNSYQQKEWVVQQFCWYGFFMSQVVEGMKPSFQLQKIDP